ncbi:histidinol-phosphate transaminase [Shewanella oneidensis MR-1]|uniref:Histidinol-phosphate aminotransferase n=1 Tax=Shewanella oneidensis (strain ATCC 700550 / JCM 31522 / CIP 106686 / LMG 19005 / NCIMB 14063 / MR-1) TaxID=211586 RepID=HIS8_SHEON|nr:histidinol-phosphate transaminase [Shewanella oneidensis]Q8EFB2.1 RecName: Full=Histidinol-phosphate aminotransferase; AltName: Full=Imidazole acetol-phosphate transaminase [Shewanella oneidensis MR-1]AAN55119.1 histidinol-phosphate aminotransferase HisC [Shewanella oneidensis MR-1]MDX5996189.1 histidinol-phosphate transaminase [Shewanella oneidensis]MEE2029919.1 Histidinol-phosphate aminotransferase [Shewanella oneidensis]QKG96687.1 histidinol-phosphate transaminase [Shewanella oneidensis 
MSQEPICQEPMSNVTVRSVPSDNSASNPLDKIVIESATLAARLARPELLELTPYQSARRLGGKGDIWINANESPFNNVAVGELDLTKLNRYPECQPPALINAYSQYSGVVESKIVASRGADEAIELLIRAFCIPGIDSIATFGPTYGMYAISAQTFNVGVKALSLSAEYGLPADFATAARGAKLVFICNPNNPTGTVIDKARIEQAIQALPDSIVVVDEAYIEFCPEYSVADLLETYPNLVVLRTLSKAFALAGARCGFLLANEEIIEIIMRVIAPYPVPLPVSEVAEQALSPAGIARMKTQVKELNTQGERLAAALNLYCEQWGGAVLKPNGNYVLAEFDDVAKVAKLLTDNGIVARAYKDPRLAKAIRFSFSSQVDTDRLVSLFESQKR